MKKEKEAAKEGRKKERGHQKEKSKRKEGIKKGRHAWHACRRGARFHSHDHGFSAKCGTAKAITGFLQIR
ncbi:MAG: hypothetical protein J5721_06715 [Lachnospiraceae bacterium]|nr:hypothetical protein [Lachnospiraceae bacterium]